MAKDPFADLGFVPVAQGDSNPIDTALDFMPESKQEQDKRLEEEAYDNPLLAGAAGAARGVSFGLSDVAGAAVGLDDELAKLKKYNPTASTVGDVTGAIGSAFLLPGAALAKGAATVGAELGGGALARAVGTALVEGTAYGAGQGVSEVALDQNSMTPEQMAETIASNVGMGALTGGVLSLGGSAVGKAAKGLSKGISKTVGKFTGAPEGASLSPLDDLAAAATMKLSKDAPEVLAAADSFGLTADQIPRSLTSDSQLVRKGEKYLAETPMSFAGGRAEAKYARTYSAIEDGIKNKVLGNAIDDGIVPSAKQFSDDLVKSLDNRLAPIEEGYEKFGELASQIEIPQEAKEEFASKILQIEKNALNKKSPAVSAAREYAEAILNPTNLDELKSLRTDVGKEIRDLNAFGSTKNTARRDALVEIYDNLTSMRENLIERAVKETGIPTPEGKAVTKGMVDELRNLNKSFAQEKRFVQDLGESLGFKKVGSSEQLAEKIAGMNDQVALNKLFNTKDKSSLEFIKGSMPDLYASLQNNFKSQLYKNSMGQTPMGKQFSVNKFIENVNNLKLSDDMLRLVLGDAEAATFKNAKKLVDKMPEKFMKGSADWHAMRKSQGLTSALINNVKDEALYQAINLAPKLRRAMDAENKTINSGVKNFFKEELPRAGKYGSIKGILSVYGPDTSDKRMDHLAQLASDPNALIDQISQNTGGLFEADSGVQGALADKTVQAVNFLSEKAPKAPPQMDIFSDRKYNFSDAQLSKFNRYVKAADNPLSILEDFQERVLTLEAVETVKTLYPNVYKKITEAAVDQAAKKKQMPYQDKMQLSILLGMPVSSTMNGKFIAQMQGSALDPTKSDGQIQQEVAASDIRVTGLKNLSVASDTQTQTQKIVNR